MLPKDRNLQRRHLQAAGNQQLRCCHFSSFSTFIQETRDLLELLRRLSVGRNIYRVHCLLYRPIVSSLFRIRDHWSNFQFSVESNPGLHWFCFTTLCDWSRNLAPPSQPIRCKTKSNLDLVTCVLSRLRPVTCASFDFSLRC